MVPSAQGLQRLVGMGWGDLKPGETGARRGAMASGAAYCAGYLGMLIGDCWLGLRMLDKSMMRRMALGVSFRCQCGRFTHLWLRSSERCCTCCC